jgi:hypothetical protein
MTDERRGTCEHCGESFAFCLTHNGFNESFYAYCSACGMTAILHTMYKDRAADGLPRHRSITAGGERYLAPCSCGGAFLPGESPRCPHCQQRLSAVAATPWIEAAYPPGSAKGWKWQQDWLGLYSITIEDRWMKDPWRSSSSGPAA